MTFFYVLSLNDPVKIRAAVKEKYSNVYELSPTVMVISDKSDPELSAQQMRDAIGLTENGLGAQNVLGLVIKSANSAGFAPSELWEWFKAQRGSA